MNIKHLFFSALIAIALCCISACKHAAPALVILHTDDTHSQVDPTDVNDKTFEGRGGYGRRMNAINIVRENSGDTAVLLLDAGDYFQGTPFFNIYHGRVEIEAMNLMGYDAATLGNHEFDFGLDTLAARLREANFPIVCANYDVAGTPLEGIVKPYTIIRRNGLKIGVFGLGVSDESLISARNFKPVRYTDPIAAAEKCVSELRDKKHCDIVICLSHLGFTFEDKVDQVGDSLLVSKITGIDAVVGGHTHMMVTRMVGNAHGDSIPVAQMKKTGSYLGKITLTLNR